jgi:ABC-type sugar transport system ATPase subunit
MIEIEGLSVDLDTFSLRDITFNVQDGEYLVLLGPTGAGKTVLLEAIAGLKPLASGRININGRDVTSFNLEKRNIGFAYQDYVLYPHLSVRDNISFGLMWRRKTKREIEQAIDQVVELLGIKYLLEKRPLALSGGESQKISLARAVAIRPDLLLLDEPLSALDPETKEEYGRELKELHKRLRLTTIHVTHDFEEALALGDRIAVMKEGQIIQIGTPEHIFRHPNSEFVARFFMTRNIFAGEVAEGTDGQSHFGIGELKLSVVTPLRGKLQASIRPEDILISKEPLSSPALNCLTGTVSRISGRGSIVYITINVPPEFTCLVLRRSFEEMNLEEKQKVFIAFKVSAVNIFSDKEGDHLKTAGG